MIIVMPEEIVIIVNKARLKKYIRTASFVGVSVFLYSDNILNIVKKYRIYEAKAGNENSNLAISGYWAGYKLARKIAKVNDLEIEEVICASLAKLVGVI